MLPVENINCPSDHFKNVGTIQVFVLRCRSDGTDRRLPFEDPSLPQKQRAGAPLPSILHKEVDFARTEPAESSESETSDSSSESFEPFPGFFDTTPATELPPSPLEDNSFEDAGLAGFFGLDGPGYYHPERPRRSTRPYRHRDDSDSSDGSPRPRRRSTRIRYEDREYRREEPRRSYQSSDPTHFLPPPAPPEPISSQYLPSQYQAPPPMWSQHPANGFYGYDIPSHAPPPSAPPPQLQSMPRSTSHNHFQLPIPHRPGVPVYGYVPGPAGYYYYNSPPPPSEQPHLSHVSPNSYTGPPYAHITAASYPYSSIPPEKYPDSFEHSAPPDYTGQDHRHPYNPNVPQQGQHPPAISRGSQNSPATVVVNVNNPQNGTQPQSSTGQWPQHSDWHNNEYQQGQNFQQGPNSNTQEGGQGQQDQTQPDTTKNDQTWGNNQDQNNNQGWTNDEGSNNGPSQPQDEWNTDGNNPGWSDDNNQNNDSDWPDPNAQTADSGWTNNSNTNNDNQQQESSWGSDKNNQTASNADWTNQNTSSNDWNTDQPEQGSSGQQAEPKITTLQSQFVPFVSPYQLPKATHQEPPLYTIPKTVAAEKGLTHQVQPGEAWDYWRLYGNPIYKDTFQKPYARFVFKYRVPGKLCSALGRSGRRWTC